MKLIYPGLFQNTNVIEALFTEANRDTVNPDRTIPGLDLGINTLSDSEKVGHNIRILADQIGWEPNQIATAQQVHGTHIERVDKPGLYPNTDGLITNKRGIALGIQVADCAAVIIADPVSKTIGTFHAGWKGAAAGIVNKGLEMMEIKPVNLKHTLAYISPCISLKNFEVGEEVAKKFPDAFVDRNSFSKPHVDLKNYIYHQLHQDGLLEENIYCSEECTYDDNRFYSFRREREQAGRMLALVKITS